MKLNIKDTFNKELPADPIQENYRRQVKKACYSFVNTRIPSNPSLIHTSTDMLKSIGLTEEDANSEAFLSIFSGKKKLEKSKPYAMCYAGHQFGSWAGQLGDGRAINLAEIEHDSKKWTLQLKGAGETPYSRSADGLAVLRSSIREYLCSEAMFYLGVPTTRALSIVLTGDEVLRDVMYDGNPAYEKGAIVCRTSPSFIRFGSFEIFAAQQDFETQKQLIDYTIKHHFQHLGKPSKEVYVQFFKEVTSKSLAMVIDWQRVGFVHGVMNTDNMSILGLTIDYGPYGWLEGYDHGWTPNTTDNTHKRYRFGAQPQIVQWNLYQLANAIFPLIEDAKALESILVHYKIDFEVAYLQMMKSKIGLFSEDENDKALVENLEQILQLTETDMTLFFRNLASFSKEKKVDGLSIISDAFYQPTAVTSLIEERWKKWFLQYKNRLQKETLNDEQRLFKMNQINPKYVLRNYMAQLAIDAANKGDYTVLDELFNVLKKPYDEQLEFQKWFAKRPEWARHKVGCSMLSCSS